MENTLFKINKTLLTIESVQTDSHKFALFTTCIWSHGLIAVKATWYESCNTC